MKLVWLLVVCAAAGCNISRRHWCCDDHGAHASEREGHSHAAASTYGDRTDAEVAVESMPSSRRSRDMEDDSMRGRERVREVDRTQVDEGMADSGQPDWTMHRRFATTRSYVMGPEQIQFEQWMRVQSPRHGGPRQMWRSELGIGFGERFDFHLGEEIGRTGHHSARQQAVTADVGYAFAPWGSIPTNPALVVGYRGIHHGRDAGEVKLVLADDFGGGDYQWASTFSWTEALGNPHIRDLGASFGVSRALADRHFSVGAEARFNNVSLRHHREDSENTLMLGPSFQWRPTENMFLDLVPLVGVTHSDRRDPRLEVYLVFGIDFGPEHTGRGTPGR